MNWLRGFRRLGWVLVALSAVPAWWISSAEATYTVTVEGEFHAWQDARPMLTDYRKADAAEVAARAKNPKERDWQTVLKVPEKIYLDKNGNEYRKKQQGDDFRAVSEMSDEELLSALQTSDPNRFYGFLRLTPPLVEQSRVNRLKFVGIFLLSILAVTILIQGVIFTAAWVLRGFR